MEINLQRSLPKRVWIGQGESGFWQPISYDTLPLYCTNCSRLGHAVGNCSDPIISLPKKPKQNQEWRPKITLTDHPSSSGLSLEAKSVIPTDIQHSNTTDSVVVLDPPMDKDRYNEPLSDTAKPVAGSPTPPNIGPQPQLAAIFLNLSTVIL